MLVNLVHLSAKEKMMVERFKSMLVQAFLTVSGLISMVMMVISLVKLWR